MAEQHTFDPVAVALAVRRGQVSLKSVPEHRRLEVRRALSNDRQLIQRARSEPGHRHRIEGHAPLRRTRVS
jgi:hypothetical protein